MTTADLTDITAYGRTVLQYSNREALKSGLAITLQDITGMTIVGRTLATLNTNDQLKSYVSYYASDIVDHGRFGARLFQTSTRGEAWSLLLGSNDEYDFIWDTAYYGHNSNAVPDFCCGGAVASNSPPSISSFNLTDSGAFGIALFRQRARRALRGC